MAEGTYQRKQRTGLWRFYNEEEVLVSEEYYKNGKRHGTASIYFPDGETVSEVCDYENGEKEGPWKQYFTDQTLKTSGNYVNGLLEGEVIYYHPDGKIMARGKYFRNKREGLWELFDKDGTSLDPQHYKAGVLLESE